jgi:hypothetical protein
MPLIDAGAHEADSAQAEVAATAVSSKRTVIAAVNTDGYVVSVRLDDEVRKWDAATIQRRVTAVAAVAHDRYLAGLGAADGRYPTMEAVADAESKLDF